MSRNIYFVVYPDFELLDLSGPVSVLSAANSLSSQPLYRIQTIASSAGMVSSSAGIPIVSKGLVDVQCDSQTSILVVGGEREPLIAASKDIDLLDWLNLQSQYVERFGSICSGTFLLQAAGIIKDKIVTTHWAGCEDLRRQKGKASVLQDALYHIDGRCWTSAGVTTGIDMLLEMVKRDHGSALMHSIAKYLVVYSQRPGKQSQFAEMQDMKPNEEDGFSALINWLKTQLTRPVSITEMSNFMCMSDRSFQRKFSTVFNSSPSRFFERMRMEYARDFLLPRHTIDVSARQLGYRSTTAFRQCFEKHFGLSPSVWQKVR